MLRTDEARAQDPPVLTVVGTVSHPPVKEASALVASRRHADIVWTLCDSGNFPHLYAIDRTGRLRAEFVVEGAVNLDWESLAIDDDGHLFIADVGNNLGLASRWIYRIAEPESLPADGDPPAANSSPLSARIEQVIVYDFPEQPFDVEATFFHKGQLYLISKERPDARLYRLPLDGESGRVTLTFVCDLPGVDRATGADITSDAQRLAVCTYTDVLLYRLSEDPDGTLQLHREHTIPFTASAVEGCGWEGDDLLLISEDRTIYRVELPHTDNE